jgi:hypothetical protein
MIATSEHSCYPGKYVERGIQAAEALHRLHAVEAMTGQLRSTTQDVSLRRSEAIVVRDSKMGLIKN